MNPIYLIAFFLLLAAMLGFFEIIVPGGILGLIGLILVFAAAVVGYMNYGLGIGLLIAAGGTILGIILFFVELWVVQKSPWGKSMVVESKIEGSSRKPQSGDELIGAKGTALTSLVPSGKVEIDGQLYDAASVSGFIEEGVDIVVVRINNFNVLVKEL